MLCYQQYPEAENFLKAIQHASTINFPIQAQRNAALNALNEALTGPRAVPLGKIVSRSTRFPDNYRLVDVHSSALSGPIEQLRLALETKTREKDRGVRSEASGPEPNQLNDAQVAFRKALQEVREALRSAIMYRDNFETGNHLDWGHD